jgi:hypothetical protein
VKVLATIALSLVVLVTAFLCFCFSICATSSVRQIDRTSFALADLVDIAIMLGAILLIAKLHKKR